VSAAQTASLAFRLARRELSGGIRGFRIFLLCLTLGVMAIAAVGSLSDAIVAGLKRDAKSILGGDVDISLTQQPATPEQLAFLTAHSAALSATLDMRAMAIQPDGGQRTLIQLKSVDSAYPLYGAASFDPPADLAAVFDDKGAAIEPSLAARLHLKIGDPLRIGDAVLIVRGLIGHEPDRAVSGFDFGPHVLISPASLTATGLIQPGSLVTYHYRLKLAPGTDLTAWRADLATAFPGAGWRIRDYGQASPGIQNFVERMGLFLTLVGLTTLLVGGVGIGNAVSSYLATRQVSIATLKCLGAPGRLIFATYLLLVSVLALLGIAIGIVVGALAPYLAGGVFGDLLPVPLALGVYPGALALAALFGILTMLAFTLWPLGRAVDVKAASLFREVVAGAAGRPRRPYLAGIALAVIALAALAVVSAEQHRFAAYFVAATAGSFATFRLVGSGLMALAGRLGRSGSPRLRLALGNLYRPGAATVSVVLSLGLGLTVLVVVATLQGNLAHEVADRLPAQAPTFFFIDLQPSQIGEFNDILKSIPGVGKVEEVPSLRGRITKINHIQSEQAKVAPDATWAIDSDRGLTYAADAPAGSHIVAGEWWPADYKGPPLISLDAALAKGFGVEVGDTLTLNVLGRDIEARIGNLRQIDWSTLGINFAVIFAPGALEAAPHTFIAIARTDAGAEEPVLRQVTDRLPNVSAIRVKDALDTVNGILASIGAAARAVGALSLLAGTLVLGGAMVASHHRRVQDAVILKVLGATRRDIVEAFLLEYALLGLSTAILAALIGSVAAWAVVTQMMKAEWAFLPLTIGATLVLATLATMAMGLVGTWRALGQKAAPLLRNA
jgi:putative ABC transport system permease protein